MFELAARVRRRRRSPARVVVRRLQRRASELQRQNAALHDALARHEAQAQLQLQRAVDDRLGVVGRLAASVGHEISNPLTYTLTSLELASRAVARDAGSSVTHLLATAREGAERIRGVVADLRMLAQDERASAEPFDVRLLLGACTRILRDELSQRARLVVEYEPVPLVSADALRLGQVLIDLMINAAHAFAEDSSQENTIQLRTSTGPNGEALIEIRDSGARLVESGTDRMPASPSTARPLGHDGLGLAVCRSIVSGLGGSLTAQTSAPRGTLLRLTLPAAPAAARLV